MQSSWAFKWCCEKKINDTTSIEMAFRYIQFKLWIFFY